MMGVIEILCGIIFLLMLIVCFILKSFKFPPLERIKMALEKGKRRKKVEEFIERTRRREIPTLKISTTLGIICFLLALVLTHKVFFMVVTTDSMVPTFKRGDMFLAQAIQIEPEKGDIVVFERMEIGLPISHRILKIEGERIYTGGDASGPDSWFITKKDIIAEAVTIGGVPIVIKDFGKYFILEAKELRAIGPYGQEYLFYKNLVSTFRSYALAIIIIFSALYIYLELKRT
jgi:signal peptidase